MKKVILILFIVAGISLPIAGNALGFAAGFLGLTPISEPFVMLTVGSGLVWLAGLGRKKA